MQEGNVFFILVGACDVGNSFDNPDIECLWLLARQASLGGAEIFLNTNGMPEQIRSQKPETVEVAGRFAGACVAGAIIPLLNEGVEVVVNLHKIRSDSQDCGTDVSLDVLNERLERLLKGLAEYASDNLLEITY